jgi:hypothetical protein
MKKELKNVSQAIEKRMKEEGSLPIVPVNPGECDWCGNEDGIGCGAGKVDLHYHHWRLDSGREFFDGWVSDACLELVILAAEATDNDNS